MILATPFGATENKGETSGLAVYNTICYILDVPSREAGIRMDGNVLKEARRKKNWTQQQAALALDVTQAYLSMLEKGRRPLSERFVCKAVKVFHVPPTALPLRSEQAVTPGSFQMRDFRAELGALGYPGFSYLRARRRRNPAEVLFDALNQANLDS